MLWNARSRRKGHVPQALGLFSHHFIINVLSILLVPLCYYVWRFCTFRIGLIVFNFFKSYFQTLQLLAISHFLERVLIEGMDSKLQADPVCSMRTRSRIRDIVERPQ